LGEPGYGAEAAASVHLINLVFRLTVLVEADVRVRVQFGVCVDVAIVNAHLYRCEFSLFESRRGEHAGRLGHGKHALSDIVQFGAHVPDALGTLGAVLLRVRAQVAHGVAVQVFA